MCFRESFEVASTSSVICKLHDRLENGKRQVLTFTIAFQEIMLRDELIIIKTFLKNIALLISSGKDRESILICLLSFLSIQVFQQFSKTCFVLNSENI